MNYTKPEVAVLGKAAVVIETTISPKSNSTYDGSLLAVTAAYDLDE